MLKQKVRVEVPVHSQTLFTFSYWPLFLYIICEEQLGRVLSSNRGLFLYIKLVWRLALNQKLLSGLKPIQSECAATPHPTIKREKLLSGLHELFPYSQRPDSALTIAQGNDKSIMFSKAMEKKKKNHCTDLVLLGKNWCFDRCHVTSLAAEFHIAMHVQSCLIQLLCNSHSHLEHKLHSFAIHLNIHRLCF